MTNINKNTIFTILKNLELDMTENLQIFSVIGDKNKFLKIKLKENLTSLGYIPLLKCRFRESLHTEKSRKNKFFYFLIFRL